jgi:hypothetical protein
VILPGGSFISGRGSCLMKEYRSPDAKKTEIMNRALRSLFNKRQIKEEMINKLNEKGKKGEKLKAAIPRIKDMAEDITPSQSL